MKKIETKFYCDDCRSPLPNNFVKGEGEESKFLLDEYNTVRRLFNMQTDSVSAYIRVALRVDAPYVPSFRELCPVCRVKWLRIALDDFERQAERYVKEQENDRARKRTDTENH